MPRHLTTSLLLLALAAPLAAQTSEAPNLIFTISGGMTSGGAMWAVSPQVIPVAPVGADSFTISRRLRPGLVATLGASFFRGPHFGYTFEAGYFGLSSESRCSILGTYATDPDSTNMQACDKINGAHLATSAVGFQAGVTYRFAPADVFSPYLRASGGLGLLGNSFVQTEAEVISLACTPFSTCRQPLLRESKRAEFAMLGTLAVGFTVATSPGYRFRFEARDLLAWLPDVTGPAPVTPGVQGAAPTGTTLRHVFVLTAGLDVVLERRHRRRY